MNWSQIRKQTRLEGGYLDLLEEEIPNVPYHSELASNCVYRGKIAKIMWEEKGPIFKIVEVTEYDSKLSIWHQQSPEEMEVDLRRPGVMEPQVMKENGIIEVATLKGFSVMIYPADIFLPSGPRQPSFALKDILKIAGLID